MNLDWLNPYKAVRNAWSETKAHSKSKGSGKHESIGSGFGKAGDPIGMTLWPKLSTYFNTRIPKAANQYLSGVMKKDPFINLDKKYGVGHYVGNGVTDWVTDKPADSIAAVIGAIYGAGAAAAAWGGGAAGGAGGAGAGAGGAAGGAGSTVAAGPWAGGYVGANLGGAGSGFGSLAGVGGGTAGGAGAAGGAAASATPGLAGAYSPYGPYASGYQFEGGAMNLGEPAAATPTSGWQDAIKNMKTGQQQQDEEDERRKRDAIRNQPGSIIFPESW